MEEISNLKNFSICISCLSKIQDIGRLSKKDGKTILSAYDGIVFILCEVPELKQEYDTYLDLRTMIKLCKTLDEKDKLNIEIQDSHVEAIIKKSKTERKYKFPNLVEDDKNKHDKSIDKASKINPTNEVQTSPDWIMEQIDSLIFKEINKNTQKVIFNLKEKVFFLKDSNETQGESTISLFDFGEYKIKFIKESKVKINYYMIKDLIPLLKQFSDKILIKLDSDYPLKIVAYDQMYKITIIIAPWIENN